MSPSFSSFRRFSLCLCIAALVSGCEVNSNGTAIADPPHCTLTSLSELSPAKPGAFATMRAVVTSDGEGTAYNVVLKVKLKRGNLIVGQDFAAFTSLERGEAIGYDLVFTGVQSASDYDKVETSLIWQDYDGGVYP